MSVSASSARVESRLTSSSIETAWSVAGQRLELGDLAFEVGDRLFEIEIRLHQSPWVSILAGRHRSALRRVIKWPESGGGSIGGETGYALSASGWWVSTSVRSFSSSTWV